MRKRNCKSKYRSISPDPPVLTSPRSREPPHGSSQARRDSDVPDSSQSRVMFSKRSSHYFEMELITSPRSREPPPGSSQARRDSDVHDADQSRVMFSKRSSHYFEVSDSSDNVHSPYYLHSSDHPGLVLTADKLDGTNYGTWFVAMTTSIEAKNKLGFIDDDDPYCKIWSRCNSMVKLWLLNSVTKKIYTSILYFNTTSDIWKNLHTRFHKSNFPRLYKQRQQIHSLRQGSLDLSAYHTQIQSLWAELTSLQATARTIEDLVAERETNHVIDFLMSLNDNYDTVRSQILMKKSRPSLSEVYNIIDQEESQKSARLPSHSSVDSSTFHTQVHPNPVQSGNQAVGKVHQQALHKDLAYIKGTVGQGLFYPADSELQLIGYADADYGSCLDTRRSISGYCFFLGSWKSKKRQIVAKSYAEAEYRSRSTASDDLVWLLNFLNALLVHLIAIAFERDWLQVCFNCGLFQLLHVRTNEHYIFTTTLYPSQFLHLVSKMGLLTLFVPS